MKESIKQEFVNKWMVFVAVGIMVMMINLDATIIYLALAPISKAFHSSLTTIQWVVNIYLLVTASLFIFAGRMADMFSKKNIFLFGVAVFTLASALAGLSNNQVILIIARAFQGVGFAFTFTLAVLIVTSCFPLDKHGFAIGSLICVTGFSQAIGPTLGGFILHYFSWRWIFLMNLPLGLISIFLTTKFYPKDKPQHVGKKLDIPGAIVLLCGLSSLIFSLNMLGVWGFFSAKFLIFVLIAIALLVFFIFLEKKKEFPLVNFSVTKDHAFFAVNVLRFIYMYCWLIILFFLPLFLQNIEGVNSLRTGIYLLFMTVLFGIVSPFMGKFIDRHGSKIPTIIALLFAMVGLIFFVFLRYFSMFFPLFFGLLCFGISAGIILSSSVKAALTTLENQHSGVGLGIFYTLAFIGGGAGVALAGSQLNLQAFYYFKQLIANGHIMLTSKQLAIMHNFVNGSRSLQQLHKFIPAIYVNKLVEVSRHAFLNAFSNVMIVCVVLMIVAIIFSFRLYSKERELNIKGGK
ncbi:MAG: MFS transporter [Gammaproteobacteria bacterium]|jgi:EmrB/QacA subfamily drug resistance transporter